MVQCAPTAWMLGERRRWLALRRSRSGRRGEGAAEGAGCCSTAMKEKQIPLPRRSVIARHRLATWVAISLMPHTRGQGRSSSVRRWALLVQMLSEWKGCTSQLAQMREEHRGRVGFRVTGALPLPSPLSAIFPLLKQSLLGCFTFR